MQIVMEWEGVQYVYDPEMVGVEEARVVKQRTNMGLKTMSREVDDMNPDAIRALFYLMKCQQEGPTPIFETCDPKHPVKFMNTFNRLMIDVMTEEAKKARAEAVDRALADQQENPSTPTPISDTSAT